MRTALAKSTLGLVLILLGGAAQQVTPSNAYPLRAVEATLAAFESYSVVGIGEAHSLQELGNFYIELVREPAFAHDVGTVVIEISR